MAKKDRTGNRKTRDQRKQFKVPELGYYLIVTDTEATERCDYTFDMGGGGCRNTIVKGYSCGYIMVKWYEK
jgi:hypothetical protein